MNLDARYWQSRYEEGNTPWDIDGISPAVLEYMSNIPSDQIRILIPGAGKAHEAAWLHQHGFRNVFVCDWAEGAFKTFKEIAPDFPSYHLMVSDFFELEGKFDLILEQTFFCAIDPKRRSDYAKKCASLLNPGGKLAGLLFASAFDHAGPPFGGTKSEYLEIFLPYFNIIHMDISEKSITPRLGNELFFEAVIIK
ncbi:MAG: methyltransferase domain-containing protein [Saprospiraceae bacterium]|nr:methyltransferase domain-containing protein [Saprospiraceae bacterium]